MFGRLVLAKSEAILGKPTSEFVLKSTLQAGGYVRSQFFVVVGVAKMFLEGSPNVVRSLQDARAEVFVTLHNDVHSCCGPSAGS